MCKDWSENLPMILYIPMECNYSPTEDVAGQWSRIFPQDMRMFGGGYDCCHQRARIQVKNSKGDQTGN